MAVCKHFGSLDRLVSRVLLGWDDRSCNVNRCSTTVGHNTGRLGLTSSTSSNFTTSHSHIQTPLGSNPLCPLTAPHVNCPADENLCTKTCRQIIRVVKQWVSKTARKKQKNKTVVIKRQRWKPHLCHRYCSAFPGQSLACSAPLQCR